MIERWLKRLARKVGLDRRSPLLSEAEFLAFRKAVLFPDDRDPVERFTKAFTRYLGVRHGVAVNSGTSALEVAVAAAGVGPGDEVIVPSYSYYSTASAVMKAGADAVFADVRLDDGGIDPDAIRRMSTEKTKAVIAVHLAGVPVDLDAILDLCRARGMTLIEDVAQAVGSEWRGRKLGSFGALGCFSFQASKQLGAGEGGFIATDDERLFSLCSAYSNVGLLPNVSDEEHTLLGGNYRLPRLEAALLSILLEKIDESMDRRAENATFLTASLSGIPGITPARRPSHATRINLHFYGLRYDKPRFGGMPKSEVLSFLRNEGLPAEGGYPSPLYSHPAFGERTELLSSGHPNTLELCATTIGFPQDFLTGSRRDMEHAVHTIRKLAERYADGVGAR